MEQTDDRQARKKVFKEIFSWFRAIAVGVALAVILSQFVFANSAVPTGSMSDTIPAHARVFGFRLAYVADDPHRGDIVIFHMPDEPDGIPYLKRIIGLPGDTVEGKDGEVLVNGTALTEPYIKDQLDKDFGPFSVPQEHFFMMGDNRNDSYDSRFWNNKFVARDQIMARVMFEYSPRFRVFLRNDPLKK